MKSTPSWKIWPARGGVILVTSDLQELIRVSHRILVMRNGRIVKEFDRGMVTQAMVLEAGSGITEEAAQ